MSYAVYYHGGIVYGIEETLKELGAKFGEWDKVAFFDEYEDGTKLSNIIPLSQANNKDFVVSFVKISDYNNMRKINNKEPITLESDQVLITSNFSTITGVIKEFMENNHTITLKGKQYEIKNKDLIEENFRTELMR